jgi:hypothetical protein
VLRDGRIATPDTWISFTDSFDLALDLVAADESLARAWLPTWEQLTHQSLRDAIREVRSEHLQDIAIAMRRLSRSDHPSECYRAILREIGGLNAESLGSGTKTALLAAVLSFLFRDVGVAEAIVAASNELGSDTDTIATMTGALLGGLTDVAPKILPLDSGYLRRDAERLADISEGKRAASFAYPDLLHWRAPRTQLDAVGTVDGSVFVAGLGQAVPTGKRAIAPKQENVEWEWLQLSFGQTVLAKRRTTLSPLPRYSVPQPPITPSDTRRVSKSIRETQRPHYDPAEPVDHVAQASLFGDPAEQPRTSSGRRSLDRLTEDAIRSGFHPVAVGKHLIELIDTSASPIEDAIGYAAILAKARLARIRGRARIEESPQDK